MNHPFRKTLAKHYYSCQNQSKSKKKKNQRRAISVPKTLAMYRWSFQRSRESVVAHLTRTYFSTHVFCWFYQRSVGRSCYFPPCAEQCMQLCPLFTSMPVHACARWPILSRANINYGSVSSSSIVSAITIMLGFSIKHLVSVVYELAHILLCVPLAPAHILSHISPSFRPCNTKSFFASLSCSRSAQRWRTLSVFLYFFRFHARTTGFSTP